MVVTTFEGEEEDENSGTTLGGRSVEVEAGNVDDLVDRNG